MRENQENNEDTDEPLLNTNERIHSCVRVRLACKGMSLDDRHVWDCEPLLKGANGGRLWKLEHRPGFEGPEAEALKSFRPRELDLSESEYPEEYLYPLQEGDSQWRWVFAGTAQNGVPQATMLPEEPMVGYWERYLLSLTVGKTDVWRWAENNPPSVAMGTQ
jgi:hypothetical protein